MKIQATLDSQDIDVLVRSLLPLRLALGDDENPWKRVATVDKVTSVEITAGHGARVVAPVEIVWPARTVMRSFTVDEVELMLELRLSETRHGMGLDVSLRCDGLDVKWLPDFIDESAAKMIDDKLRETNLLFTWDFSETLTFQVEEGSARTNLSSVDFTVTHGALSVSDAAARLMVPMTMKAKHAA